MSFQWDLFLVETGILAFFLIRPSMLGILLMRWLLFRFFIAAGLVKLLSGDASWPGFTALSNYFFTQPLPTPLAWHANQLPESILKACTCLTLVIELIIPFFIFLPRKLRFFAGYCFLLLQTIILLTSNYNFFNILTIILCLLLFDDAAIRSAFPKRLAQRISHRITKSPRIMMTIFASAFAVVTIFISIVQLNLRFGHLPPIPIVWVYDKIGDINALRLVNVYGPFAVITPERREIILEGSYDNVNWQEYTFKYKPGDINRRPFWNIPFQPRLDWQMWFAALDTPENNPWFARLLQRLLENSPTVIGLLENNPFADKPPVYLRADFYDYHFTTREEKEKTGAWWERRLVRLYFP